jgi:hypothetical protein
VKLNPDVLATTRFVVENSRDVAIDRAAIERVTHDLVARPRPVVTYDCTRHLCGTGPEVANFVLVLDTLNFSFWPDPGQARWMVSDNGEVLNGYWALVAALRRAIANGAPLSDADYLSTITAKSLGDLLGGTGTIPLLDERAAALHEAGRSLLARDGGQFVNTIARANGSATTLAALLATELSSFADVATYRGHPVTFLKRAQICAGDLHGASGGQAWGNLTDLDRLTAFADYKIPQVLRGLDVLVYSETLAHAVDHLVPLAPGGEPEIEIRAATIWSVEYLRRALAARGVSRRPFEIDWQLWELGQLLPPDTRPYHRTRTTFY